MAARFAQAFTSLGLTGATWTQRVDTAWAHAGPTALGAAWGGGTYAARVVAYRQGDSTRFRHFVGLTPQPTDRASPAERRIGFCGELGRLAAVHGTAPRDPDGEETLPIWRRRP